MKKPPLTVVSFLTAFTIFQVSAQSPEDMSQTLSDSPEATSTAPAVSVGKGITSMVGADLRPSYAFPSFKDDILRELLTTDQARKTVITNSIHLKYGFTFSPATSAGRLYPGTWQGIGASVNMLGNTKGIGNPVCLYLFQGAPIWHIRRRLSLYYEWNFGASFGWKACDGKTAYSNLIVGSKVNAYINLGTGLVWNLPKGWSVTAGVDLTHFSNGNTSFPNPGVNMAGIRVGVSHSFGKHSPGTSYPTAGRATWDNDTTRHRKISYDLTLYGAWRKRVYRGGEEPLLLNGHFGIAGLSFAPMWKIAPIFRTGISADFQWDESTDLRRHHVSGVTPDDICFIRPPFFSQVSTGLSARAELVMPIFSVNIGIGYNIIGPEESRATYQMANLRIRLPKGLYLNIGYQLLDLQRQNNLMLGLGYTFR